MATIPETPAPAAPDLNLTVAIPNTAVPAVGDTPAVPAKSVTFDLAGIPAETRLELLRRQATTVIINRVNVAQNRFNGLDKPFVAWAAYEAYEAAKGADPLTTAAVVAKPEGEKPDFTKRPTFDPIAKAQEGVAALLKGELRAAKGESSARGRAPKDPLVQAVTNIVVREVFAKQKLANNKFTFPEASKLVGTDGIVYLNNMIAEKVAAAPEAERPALLDALNKMRDTKYIDPARVMLGLSVPKGIKDAASIL